MSNRLFASPMFLGFDYLEQMVERVARGTDSYPPYNVEQLSPTALRITLAVAGFVMDDLQITQEDNQLVIRGRQADDSQGRVFLHRGIAARQFHKAFVLAEGIEIRGAWLDNGLLHIDLHRPEPEVRVKHITITQGRREKAERPPSPVAGSVASQTAGHVEGRAAKMPTSAPVPTYQSSTYQDMDRKTGQPGTTRKAKDESPVILEQKNRGVINIE